MGPSHRPLPLTRPAPSCRSRSTRSITTRSRASRLPLASTMAREMGTRCWSKRPGSAFSSVARTRIAASREGMANVALPLRRVRGAAASKADRSRSRNVASRAATGHGAKGSSVVRASRLAVGAVRAGSADGLAPVRRLAFASSFASGPSRCACACQGKRAGVVCGCVSAGRASTSNATAIGASASTVPFAPKRVARHVKARLSTRWRAPPDSPRCKLPRRS